MMRMWQDTGSGRLDRPTTAAGGLVRKRIVAGLGAALALCLAGSAIADTPADPTASRPLPQLKTHAPPGFRLYRPGYRVAGKGALVTVQLCRLPSWAAAGPQRLRVERIDADGQPGESHEQYLPRLGMRPGINCSSAAMRLDAVPGYGETIKLCALSGRGTCP